jgi:hypothetical protein
MGKTFSPNAEVLFRPAMATAFRVRGNGEEENPDGVAGSCDTPNPSSRGSSYPG